MNEKHAREARIANRLAGFLVKKSDLPVLASGFVDTSAKKHKLPRRVKSHFDGLAHGEKAPLTRHSRSAVAFNLKLRGEKPKGDLPKSRQLTKHFWFGMPRSTRKAMIKSRNRSADLSARIEKQVKLEQLAAAIGVAL
jgi:hypothetical protein